MSLGLGIKLKKSKLKMQTWDSLTGPSKDYGTQVTGKACTPVVLKNNQTPLFFTSAFTVPIPLVCDDQIFSFPITIIQWAEDTVYVRY